MYDDVFRATKTERRLRDGLTVSAPRRATGPVPVTLAAADAVLNNGAGEASGRPRLETENIRQHVVQSTSPARIMQLKQHRSKG